MSKGSGLWKVVLAGAVISVAVSGGMYLSVPRSVDIDMGVSKASGEEFERSLYGIPDVNMGHYKLDDDSYFKYKVDGTLDISRANPSSVPNWLVDFEIWNNDEAFSEEKVAFNEKRMKILNKVGDIDAASDVESELKDQDQDQDSVDGETSEEGAESDKEPVNETGVGDGGTSNSVGDDEGVTDVGGTEESAEDGVDDGEAVIETEVDENGGSEDE